MAGQIPNDSFAGSLSDPLIDPFEVPEAGPPPTPAGQARASVKPTPGPISPDKKLPPENLYSRMRSSVLSALTPAPGSAAAQAVKAYQYVRSGGLENALGLNQPALTQEQPNPAYQPWLDKSLGAVTQAINPENPRYGMTGKLVGMIGGVMPGTVASEVPLKSIPVWGAATMAKQGATEYAPWRESMLKDFGPGVEPRLEGMYQKSKGIYEKHLAQAPLNELSENQLPNLQNIVDQYNKGVEGQDWYLNTRPELERQFGKDTDLFINLLAATSPNNTVPANVTQAVKAYKAYKSGVPFELVHPGWMKPVIANMNRAVKGEPLQGQKIASFAQNLRGETEPVTVDRWMMRALGMPTAKPDKPTTYKFADYWLSQIAHDMGVEPRQLQAAVWKTAREVGGQSAATGQPFEAMLAKRLAGDPGLKSLLGRVRSGAAPDVLQQSPSREQIITSLLPKWKQTAPTPMTGTMEVASRQTPSGEAAANLYDRLGAMDQSQPWVQELKRGYQGAQQSAFDALALPQGKQPSLLSQLRSAITGDPKSIDPTISTRGTYGTFGNEVNPNIQFSMEGMSEPQRHAMLSILGQHFNQAASAASRFEAIPRGDIRYADPDTYSVFLHSHPDPQAINQFANQVGFPVNVRQYSNGTMLDLNTGGMDVKPAEQQVKDAARATFGEQPHGVYPRRYSSDYIDSSEYQGKIDAHANGISQPIHGGRRGIGQAGNPPESYRRLPQIRQQIEAVAQARNKAFQDWARAAQARLKALGYARGGHVRWYGQNSLRPPRMADGGWADTLFGTGSLPPDPSLSAVPGVIKDSFKAQPLTAQNIIDSFSSNQDPGSYLRSAGQGLADPIYSVMQAGTKLPGQTDQQRADVMKAINDQREQYQQGLPGGREDWKHGVTRAFSGVYGLGKALPGLPEFGETIPGLMKTGALEGAVYGAFDPEEGAEPFAWGEKAKQMGLGAVTGAAFHPLIEKAEKVATPIIASPQVDRAERALGLEVERMGEEATAQPGFAKRTAKEALHSLDDVIKPRQMLQQAQQKLSDWQAQNNLNQTTDPSWQAYLQASGQGGYASGGEVYRGLRRRTLAALAARASL